MPTNEHPWANDEDKRDRNPLKNLPPVGEFEKPPEDKQPEQPILPKTNSGVVKLPFIEDQIIQPTNERDRIIEEKISRLDPPGQVVFRTRFDPRHIVNVMTVECEKCADFNPPQTFYYNLALEVLKLLHDSVPNLREKLESIRTNVQILQGRKGADPQIYVEKVLLELFKEQIK